MVRSLVQQLHIAKLLFCRTSNRSVNWETFLDQVTVAGGTLVGGRQSIRAPAPIMERVSTGWSRKEELMAVHVCVLV